MGIRHIKKGLEKLKSVVRNGARIQMEFETLSVGRMGDTGNTVRSGKKRGPFLASKNHSTAEK